MQINVTGRHVSVTEAIKKYAVEKLKHVVDKYIPLGVTKGHVIMDVVRYQQVVEVELHCRHNNIYSKFSSHDMYTSIDKVMDKIETQLMKHKSKYDENKRSGTLSIRKLNEQSEQDEQ